MNSDKFEVAKKLAEAACALDSGKMAWPDVDQAWHLAFAEKMYGVAETLAGDRKEELYKFVGDAPPTINVMPLLIAPEKLGKKELLEKCKEQHQTMILQDQTIQSACFKLAEMCRCAHDLGAQLYALVDAFDENDQEAITVQLKAMSDRRKSYIKPGVH